ncbi:MAG: hypothetical protein JNL70_11825 [Saprospiraceae bacterium]|nr:hypothetical protein [Saprospiraceae bacterium]
MEKITVPDKNTFEERAKAFSESQFGKRLAQKFEPKPYEKKRKGLYLFSWFGSFFCNIVAIITGSTFVFAYVMGLVAKLPEPMIWATLISAIILIGIEILKQLLVPDLFQDWFQFGWKSSYFFQVLGIIALIGISSTFNYFGGFDFVGAVTTPPSMEEPKLKSVEAVKREYQPKIDQATKEAELYRQSKTWKGKLSDNHATTYRQLLEDKKQLERKMLAKVDSAELFNDRANATVKSEHQENLKKFEAKTQVKGRGLALFSVVCEFLFIVFCWYRERYEYKTAIQYASINEETQKPVNTLVSNIAPLPQQSNGSSNGVKSETSQRRPIGFYPQEKVPDKNSELIVLTKTYKNTDTAYLDTFTIEHNGKRYTLRDVERFCKTYKERLEQSEQKADTETAARRRTQLSYWENKKQELIAKIEMAHIQ